MSWSYFRAWRCGASVLADELDQVPADCPEHPAAEALAATETIGRPAARLLRGLLHDTP